MSLYVSTKGFPLYFVRDQWVMLDIDLGRFLWPGSEVANIAAKRNKRFLTPEFTFQLTDIEWEQVCSLKGIRRDRRCMLPQAYTEHGMVILCVVLNRIDIAEVIQPFVHIRKITDMTRELALIVGELSAKVKEHECEIESLRAGLHQSVDASIKTPPADNDNKKGQRNGTSNLVRDDYRRQTILTYAEAALVAGVTVATICGWVGQRRNPLPRCATKGPYRIDHVELLKYIGRR